MTKFLRFKPHRGSKMYFINMDRIRSVMVKEVGSKTSVKRFQVHFRPAAGEAPILHFEVNEDVMSEFVEKMAFME